jgi:hypothetical protein
VADIGAAESFRPQRLKRRKRKEKIVGRTYGLGYVCDLPDHR